MYNSDWKYAFLSYFCNTRYILCNYNNYYLKGLFFNHILESIATHSKECRDLSLSLMYFCAHKKIFREIIWEGYLWIGGHYGWYACHHCCWNKRRVRRDSLHVRCTLRYGPPSADSPDCITQAKEPMVVDHGGFDNNNSTVAVPMITTVHWRTNC